MGLVSKEQRPNWKLSPRPETEIHHIPGDQSMDSGVPEVLDRGTIKLSNSAKLQRLVSFHLCTLEFCDESCFLNHYLYSLSFDQKVFSDIDYYNVVVDS